MAHSPKTSRPSCPHWIRGPVLFFVFADNYKRHNSLYNNHMGFVQIILKRLHKEELSGFNFVF